jgi:hypothetical protein
MTDQKLLVTLAALEAFLLARRQGPPDLEAAVQAAMVKLHGDAVPHAIAAAGHAIAQAVEAHGATFPPGTEPAYHDRHHQAEAILSAGWLGAAAMDAGLMSKHEATLLILAMAGHDLLHDGTRGEAAGALERRSALHTDALTAFLPAPDRAEITRLIMATIPEAVVKDLPARLAREADLFASFASLTPGLGWRLSHALAAEMMAAGLPGAAAIACHGGRLALLKRLPDLTPPAQALGLAAACAVQLAALARAGGDGCAEIAARNLDAMPTEENARLWHAALIALGWPERTP